MPSGCLHSIRYSSSCKNTICRLLGRHFTSAIDSAHTRQGLSVFLHPFIRFPRSGSPAPEISEQVFPPHRAVSEFHVSTFTFSILACSSPCLHRLYRHLPATLLASFVKRLSRLSLAAPPSSIVIVIPFVYNILKRHPALMCMIHRDAEPEPFEGTCFPCFTRTGLSCVHSDPFVADEPNPNLTNALDSSLWELHSHKRHYHAGVSRLVCIFEEAFTKPKYPVEDFLDQTYATVVSVVCWPPSSKLMFSVCS